MGTFKALVIERTPDSPIPGARIIDLDPTDIATMQEIVEGWLELIPGEDDWYAWGNEEGKLHGGLGYNYLATDLILRRKGGAGGWIAGSVIVVGTDGHNMTDVPERILDQLDNIQERRAEKDHDRGDE